MKTKECGVDLAAMQFPTFQIGDQVKRLRRTDALGWVHGTGDNPRNIRVVYAKHNVDIPRKSLVPVRDWDWHCADLLELVETHVPAEEVKP